ncbi:MAG: substrate-binding domain-containing protein [Albidovulum sp.]|nr:substrate-binding domain-containing protein [Albidovulum sp.]MDE0308009.1 substrate-binding domain-containing protein [Albidovulum sp.]MDE0533286.1 substrate-binding domain-containing protein [Albidovulum sp.]
MRDLAERADSLAVVAVDHPLVSDEISRLRRQGLPVWALLSDLTSPDRAGFIGIDGRKAGRTAAWAFDKNCRSGGTIGTLIGSHRYLGHEDRDAGMRAYFREKQQRFRVLEAISYLDNEEGAYDGTLNLLDRVPDLAGLHVIGGGSEGAIRALKAKAVAGKVALVCHELNDETRKGLIEGSAIMVLATPVQRIASAAARLLAARDNGYSSSQVAPVLPFEIYISENV